MEIENKGQILQRRKEIEEELLEMLKETGSDFGLEDIRDIIYNEEGSDDLTDIISMFDNGENFNELENILEVVNDAWNYFPHKVLNGLSPAEKALEYQNKKQGEANAGSIYDNYAPRNEHEICDLFEMMLFMKVDKIMPGQMSKKDAKAKKSLTLSESEMEHFSKTGMINRIFRRWYQTNWGYENVSEYFEGETPRYELSRMYPGIKQGKDYLSVNLEKIGGEWKVRPYYYSESFLKSEGGIFMYGLKKLRENKKIGEPFFDVEFKEFISWLDFGNEAILKETKKEDHFDSEFLKYWDLFLRMAPSNIVLNLKIRRLCEQEFSDLCFAIKDFLVTLFSSQPEGYNEYIYYDKAFAGLWETIRVFDDELLSYAELMNATKNEKRIEKFKKDARLKKSIECMHALGILFDRYILFPIERYFNGAELVWTNHEIFLEDLSGTMLTLKGKLKYDKSDAVGNNFLDTISPFDLKYMWFIPCTAFRLTGNIFKYFH